MRLLGNACACGSADRAARLFPTRDHNFGATTETSWMMKCPACGSIFPAVFPSPETLGMAYAVYYTQAKRRRGLRSILRAVIDATRQQHLVRSAPLAAKSVLDYGCGSGEYLRLLVERGYQARLSGTDISRPQGEAAEAFEWLTLDQYDADGRQYDWITLSHVIEHLADARAVMLRLRAACPATGALWISTPNADSLLISAFQGHARDVDFPRHRQIFTRRSLQLLLSNAGFEVSFAPSPRVDALMNWATCARNLLRDRTLGWAHKAPVLLKSLGRLAWHLMKPAANRALDGPEIVVIARPSPAPQR